MDIISHLSSNSTLKSRFESLHRLAREEILPFVNLPDYTAHGLKHTQSVIDIAGRLVPNVDILSHYDAFCFVCAAYLHDVGMFMKKDPNESSLSVRLDHYNRSRKFVINEHGALGLGRNEALIIGEICRAHGMPDLRHLDPIKASVKPFGRVKIKLLAALLRLSDILDLTSDRAPSLVSANRAIPPSSIEHWQSHQMISDVTIRPNPGWDIEIVASPNSGDSHGDLFRIQSYVQDELDTLHPTLRNHGIYYKKVDLHANLIASEYERNRLANPFILLASYDDSNQNLFAGRDKEIQDMLQLLLHKKLVILTGVSGTGKTSLIEAGLVPSLSRYGLSPIVFSFDEDPMKSIIQAIGSSGTPVAENSDIPTAISNFAESNPEVRPVFIGDHAEKLFTVERSRQAKEDFFRQLAHAMGQDFGAHFLLCVREDYIPNLIQWSHVLPELYNSDNTYQLFHLDKENATTVLVRASSAAKLEMSEELIERIVSDLCYSGGGLAYPPFLQIVGHRVYRRAKSIDVEGKGWTRIQIGLYTDLGGGQKIINDYFDELLDQYSAEEKRAVIKILNTMVTEYYTKKRMTFSEIASEIPDCPRLDKILRKLVNHRILKISLDQFELIHDFLAKKVIDYINADRFYSMPVRTAMMHIEECHARPDLTVVEVARAALVTPSHLAALFKDQLGKSPRQYISTVRLRHAEQLLREFQLSVKEICYEVGYTSISAFTRAFKKRTETTPLQYRLTHRENVRLT